MYIHVMEARLDGLDKEVRRFQAQAEKQIPRPPLRSASE
jgi:hypothetical protein